MSKTYCPSCDAEIHIGKPRLGATVICPECGDSLRIISTKPLEVDYPFDEDWGEEWEDWEEGEQEEEREGGKKEEYGDEDDDWWD